VATVLSPTWGSATDGYAWQYTFQGGRYDMATGLVLFRLRDELVKLGVWTEEDPTAWSYVDGMNLYGFEREDVPRSVDPVGLATVNLWDPGTTSAEVYTGHVSMRLCDGTYLSWWPTSSGPRSVGTAQDFKTDVSYGGGEGANPDRTIDIPCGCLNEAAIKSWWSKFSGNPSEVWSSYHQNCSWVIKEALNQGLGYGFGSPKNRPTDTHLNWTPQDVEKFAQDLKDYCKAKKRGTCSLIKRAATDSLKEPLPQNLLNIKHIWNLYKDTFGPYVG
jgi:RHS repeat-associated protein